MTKPKTTAKPPSLADFLLRYDLSAMIEEARLDYSESSAGAPRLLDQKDISARFRRPPKTGPVKEDHGPR